MVAAAQLAAAYVGRRAPWRADLGSLPVAGVCGASLAAVASLAGIGWFVCLEIVAGMDLRVRAGWVDRGITDPAGTHIFVTVALCAFVLTFAYLTALSPAWIYYLQGLEVTWFLPDPTLLAAMRDGVAQLFIVCLLLIPLPWIGSGAYGLVRAGALWWWYRE